LMNGMQGDREGGGRKHVGVTRNCGERKGRREKSD